MDKWDIKVTLTAPDGHRISISEYLNSLQEWEVRARAYQMVRALMEPAHTYDRKESSDE